MLYGMTTRFRCADPQPVWRVWDAFGIETAEMIGYWEVSLTLSLSLSLSLSRTLALILTRPRLIAPSPSRVRRGVRRPRRRCSLPRTCAAATPPWSA